MKTKTSFKKGHQYYPHKVSLNRHPLIGRKQTPEHIKKRIDARWRNGTYIGRHQSDEEKNKRSEIAKKLGYGKWMQGKKLSIETRKKQSESQKRVFSDLDRLKERGKKISLAKKGIPLYSIRGENHWNWKGNKELENDRVRHSFEYDIWRKAVFLRDKYMCQECGRVGGKLEADHIKPFSLYPELRLAIDNGRTLCKPCHRKTDTWGGNSRRNIKAI